ncbi:Transcriptional regulator, TetR family [Lachnospiraceae bacterium TWA4]|nr:Transcriptional regulator, TetR family [Lachnospiraceae bacterium TWA4]
MEQKERKTDLRVIKTREAIHSAFREMVCEMDADQITIKELTDRARIHRKTFYLHYTSIEALYADLLTQVGNEIKELLSTLPVPINPAETVRTVYEYLASKDKFIEKLICNNTYREFCNNLFTSVMKYNKDRYNPFSDLPEDEFNIITTYLSTTLLDIYRQWVADKKKMSLNRLIEIASTLTANGFYGMINQP